MTKKRKKVEWWRRPRVKNCTVQDYVDCPNCGGVTVCCHEFAEGEACTGENCPVFDEAKNRWLTAEQARKRWEHRYEY